jgi:hypothetical protein
MAMQKATEFVNYLAEHPEVASKMQGFTLDELKKAAAHAVEEHKKSGSLKGAGAAAYISVSSII